MSKFDTLVNQLLYEIVDYSAEIAEFANQVVEIYMNMVNSGKIDTSGPLGDIEGIDMAMYQWSDQYKVNSKILPMAAQLDIRERARIIINRHN